MTAAVLSPEPERAWSAADRAPLLRWLIFTGATVFAAVLLWRYGLFRLMLASDRTYISSIVGAPLLAGPGFLSPLAIGLLTNLM